MPSKDSKPKKAVAARATEPKRDWSRPGTWVAVPLPEHGYAACLIARRQESSKGTKKILVHIFGPRFGSVDEIVAPPAYALGDKIASALTFDQGIIERRWPIIGRSEPFDPKAWPLPLMKSGPFGGGPDWKRRFTVYRMDESLGPGATLGTMILENPSDYLTDTTYGHIAFESFAGRVIDGGPIDPDPEFKIYPDNPEEIREAIIRGLRRKPRS